MKTLSAAATKTPYSRYRVYALAPWRRRIGAPILLLLTILAWACLPRARAQTPDLQVLSPSGELNANVAAHVRLPSLRCDADEPQLARSLRAQRAALDASVRDAAQALGYYQTLTKYSLSAADEPSNTDDCWTLTLQIEPGIATLVESVEVSILAQPELFGPTLATLPLVAQTQLNHDNYESSKALLLSRAQELGFLDARFVESILAIDPSLHSASATLALDPGERYRFGSTQFDTGGPLSQGFVQQFQGFEEGDFYSPNRLLELRRALNDSQYFAGVSVSPQIDSAQDFAVPVNVTLTPRPRRVYEYGAGLTTDSGPRLSANYEDRFRNPSGHRFDANALLSQVQQSLDADYTIPLANPTTENLRVSMGVLQENTATFDSLSFRSSVAYTFVNRSQWRQSFFANFRHDEFTLNGYTETSDLLIPGLSLTKTQANDALLPSRGWHLFAQIRGAEKTLLASESFLQLNLSGKWIAPLGRARLLSRFELGTTLVSDIGELPTSIQYFTGGDQSVRGYDYKSLGTATADALIVGGKHLTVASLEVDFPVSDKWRLAAFVDAGSAFDALDTLSLSRSAGLGFRWVSPIGPVRLDFAHPFDSDESFRFHLTMGPDL